MKNNFEKGKKATQLKGWPNHPMRVDWLPKIKEEGVARASPQTPQRWLGWLAQANLLLFSI
jgi:hypothetical protein